MAAIENRESTVQACEFRTTRWTLVLTAADPSGPAAEAALDQLCRAYWYPLYACVRREGRNPADAADLVQAFFARLLEKGYLNRADPERGRFRDFLRSSFKHFLINDWRRGQADKRGGGCQFVPLEPADAEARYQGEPVSPELTPDKLFERRWALALLDQVLTQLRAEYEAEGKRDLFQNLKPFVWGETSGVRQAEIGARLGLTEGAVAQAVHRLRKRYGELLRAEVAHTVASPADVEDELRHLLQAVSA